MLVRCLWGPCDIPGTTVPRGGYAKNAYPCQKIINSDRRDEFGEFAWGNLINLQNFDNFEDRPERLSPGVVSGSHSGWDARGVLVGCSRDARGVLVGCAGAAGAAGAAECRSKRRGRRGRPAFERRVFDVQGCHTKLAGLSRGCPAVTRGDCRTRLETTRDSTRSKSLIPTLRVEDDLPSNAGFFIDGIEKSHDLFVLSCFLVPIFCQRELTQNVGLL